MNTYEKTYNLYKRHNRRPLIGKYDLTRLYCDAYGMVHGSAWKYTEKIDGTNIRIVITEGGNVDVFGRRNTSTPPGDLVDTCQEMAANRLDKLLPLAQNKGVATLYGEGYGPGLQKGGHYRKDKGFILFDIRLSDHASNDGHYMVPHSVENFAGYAGLTMVPSLTFPDLYHAVAATKDGFPSALGEGAPAEGLIAHAAGLFHHYDGAVRRVKFKLKTKDFPVLAGVTQ